jgi:UDP-2,3-diacylglucosamine pyrophosphatase LpxH
MKIQVLSDLHLEHCAGIESVSVEEIVPPSRGDVLVLAGDIDYGTRAMLPYGQCGVPVIYVAGNHEYYRGHIKRVNIELRQCARTIGIDYLSEDAVVIDGVRFLGTTLWTDFALYPGRERESLDAARQGVSDFSWIRTSTGFFTPEQSVLMHRVARDWLGEQLATPFDGPTVVVTHHAPSARSTPPQFVGSPVNPAFVSELTELAGLADLWIHGHCHHSCDYDWRGTRVVANPRGYPVRRETPLAWENPDFDDGFCVEV